MTATDATREMATPTALAKIREEIERTSQKFLRHLAGANGGDPEDDLDVIFDGGNRAMYCMTLPGGERICLGEGEITGDGLQMPNAVRAKLDQIKAVLAADGVECSTDCHACPAGQCKPGTCECTPAANPRGPIRKSTVSAKRVAELWQDHIAPALPPAHSGPSGRQLLDQVEAAMAKLTRAVHEKLARDQARARLDAELRRIEQNLAKTKKLIEHETLTAQLARIAHENLQYKLAKLLNR